MKKTMIRIAGFVAALTLLSVIGAGCSGGAADEVQTPKTGAKASDNPSVGQPVGAGGTPEDGGASAAKGAPGDGGRTKGR